MTLGTVEEIVGVTKKAAALAGLTLLRVRTGDGGFLIAADCADSKVGDVVLLVAGRAAQMAVGPGVPVDAAAVGVMKSEKNPSVPGPEESSF